MAVCVEVDGSGVLHASSTPLDACTSYVLMDASTYTSLPTMADVFAMPLQADLQTLWMTGFALPVICYLTAWAYQSVIDFISKDSE
jgi:hypothetical protein